MRGESDSSKTAATLERANKICVSREDIAKAAGQVLSKEFDLERDGLILSEREGAYLGNCIFDYIFHHLSR